MPTKTHKERIYVNIFREDQRIVDMAMGKIPKPQEHALDKISSGCAEKTSDNGVR